MEAAEVKRNRLYISDSSIWTSSVQEDMNISWLTQVHVKPKIPILEKLKQYPEQERRIKKLEKELFEQKMLIEIVKRQMVEMKEEYIAHEEAQTKRSEAMEKSMEKQSEDLKAMMTEMMAMMKKQQQP